MTKYIIELEDDIKYLIINGKADNRCYTLVRPVAELEELNSDYINEHYGELQDEAYQRGFEDGKKSVSDTDRIEVGDIVDVYGNLGVVTYMYELEACVMMIEDGSSGNWNLGELKKTGKHYDIASILEAMRE